jgi:hypothetical protein
MQTDTDGRGILRALLKSTIHRSVNEFLPHGLNHQILELIAQALPDWSFDVSAEALTVRIRLTKDGHSERTRTLSTRVPQRPRPRSEITADLGRSSGRDHEI